MQELGIDIETFSSVDLKKSGVYAYTEAPDFTILLFSYAIDGGEPEIVDLEMGETLPPKIWEALADPSVIKTAYNANFERACLAKYYGVPMPPEQWSDTMILAAELGLPRSLGEVAKALGLGQQKDTRGEGLIRYFSKPCKPTKANGGRTRNTPQNDLEKWHAFKEYCKQDVRTEQAIRKKLSSIPLIESEQNLWEIDQRISDRGCRVDKELVQNAIRFNQIFSDRKVQEFYQITGIDKPTKVGQLKTWVLEKTGKEPDSLDKEAVKDILASCDCDEVIQALLLRQVLAKSSVSKYEAMQRGMCQDNRLRGFLQFYGANRSGRWAGRLVQIQNLPQNHLESLEFARELVKAGDFAEFELFHDNVPQVLSELIRTAFIPSEGCRFIVADFSAIEARVIAYLAGEQWRIDAFKAGKDIYCASASKMFGVPVEKHGVNGHLRAKGKVAELACIAEDQLVLTDRGLVPIQDVRLTDKLWDGVEWVSHEGVVYRGEREIISDFGLEATPDHLIVTNQGTVPFFTLANSNNRRLGRRRVYDILNSGPRHRFTVSGCLVHNCGYQGSVGAMKNMGADKMGLTDEELQAIVDQWREASPSIVEFWNTCEQAAFDALKDKPSTIQHGIRFFKRRDILFIELPSGRRLAYIKPGIGENRFGKKSITYMGTDQKTGKWGRVETYGGKLVENIVQAFARDCLAETLRRCDAAGYEVVFHVHDEVIVDIPEGRGSTDELVSLMCAPIKWAPGLLLNAEGFEAEFYKKD